MLIQEGWSLAELFRVRCIVTAPYVVPYRYLEDWFFEISFCEFFEICGGS